MLTLHTRPKIDPTYQKMHRMSREQSMGISGPILCQRFSVKLPDERLGGLADRVSHPLKLTYLGRHAGPASSPVGKEITEPPRFGFNTVSHPAKSAYSLPKPVFRNVRRREIVFFAPSRNLCLAVRCHCLLYINHPCCGKIWLNSSRKITNYPI